MIRMIYLFGVLVLTLSCTDNGEITNPTENEPMEELYEDTLRFASFNVSMSGNTEGQIAEQMENANQYTRYKRIAAIIQKVRPDVLVLMEFDFDSTGQSLKNFNEQLLNVAQAQDEAIDYPYMMQFTSNTGLNSGVDIDENNRIEVPGDAFGFGVFEGQYASAILSKYPFDDNNIRSFQKLLWTSMPDAELPINSDGSSYYSDEALEVFRVSSKNHVDLPIVLPNNKIIHALISHPTPPVFDGTEDRNGKRNHDEIKLWADYISYEAYLIDDNGNAGGLSNDASFIVFGDLNADPVDGDSHNNAVSQLLNHERVHQDVAKGSLIPSSNGGTEHNQSSGNQGDPAFDTSFFGLRVDYVLPSRDLKPIQSGVFWPSSSEDAYDLIKNGIASDHLLVWVDIKFD